MAKWTVADIPSQKGKLAVVTGATGGLGYETALGLAHAGAEVVWEVSEKLTEVRWPAEILSIRSA